MIKCCTWGASLRSHLCDSRRAKPASLRRDTTRMNKTFGAQFKLVSVSNVLHTYIKAALHRFFHAFAYILIRNGNTVHTDTNHIVILRHGSAMEQIKYICMKTYLYFLRNVFHQFRAPGLQATWCNTWSGCRVLSLSPRRRWWTGCLTPGWHGCQMCRLLDSAGTGSRWQNLEIISRT